MTKVVAGYSATYGPFVRIMVNDADDPHTTDPDEVEKFLFDSLKDVVGYVADIVHYTYPDLAAYVTATGSGSSGYSGYYLPPGSTSSNAEIYISGQNFTPDGSGGYDNVTVYWVPTRIYNFGFEPIIEIRTILPGSNGVQSPGMQWVQNAEDPDDSSRKAGFFQGNNGYYVSLNLDVYISDAGQWAIQKYRAEQTFRFIVGPLLSNFVDVNPSGDTLVYKVATASRNYIDNPGALQLEYAVTVWELPALNDAIGLPTGTPTPGQEVVKISPSIVRIARPGYDINTATGRQLILDSDRTPAKILWSGDVTIPASSSASIDFPFPITRATYLDFHVCQTGQPLIVPPYRLNASNQSDQLRVSISVNPSLQRVTLTNPHSFSIRVVGMILGDDDSAPSTGGSKVMYSDNDGSTDFVQIKRPGSTDTNPKLRDILLDTRFKYLPLIAEGYLPVASFTESEDDDRLGNKAKTVSFTNTGFTPFVKFTIVYSDGTYSHPIIRTLKTFGGMASSWINKPANMTGCCVVNSNNVKFHLATGNPSEFSINDITGSLQTEYNKPDPVGIRYYIFAI